MQATFVRRFNKDETFLIRLAEINLCKLFAGSEER